MSPDSQHSLSATRLAALRRELAGRGLDGFLVPHADEHQSEELAPSAERLTWLTGFTGSAGSAAVLADRAAIFVDGRYTLQARQQVDTRLFEPRHVTEQPLSAWLAEHLAGKRLGYDPRLHSQSQARRLQAEARRAGGEAVAVETNPVDAVWDDRPAEPAAPVVPHPLAFAGRPSAEKRAELADRLKAEKLAAAVLTQPDSIAWLLNVRGGDVTQTPLALSFAILRDDARVEWFVAPEKVAGPELQAQLGNGVILRRPDELCEALESLGKVRVLADPGSAGAWIFDRLAEGGSEIVEGDDPCLLPKACKNPVELDGTRAAHRRDGAALSRFLHWLEETAPSGGLDELGAIGHLAGLRAAGERYRSLSFSTIAGSGPNGAVIHYRAIPATNRTIRPGEFLLVDSGAQYLDGTTDVTRTIAIGSVSDEMRRRFTGVLKGHIALARQRFPAGTTGSQLDALARMHLWQAGLDFDHGTGHGVGSYLGVHEGPQRISKVPNSVALRPGMIVSNEPGYYKEGAYGIRIENLVAVVEDARPGDEKPMLAFETLTLAPIDRHAVEPALLSAEETAWLDAYHARVRESLSPLLDGAARAWLEQATAPLIG
ncbi:Xaa-Pro aminopeptidase [Tistlia consotensis]|uniref:Xaa-Pro aminopeptidase n=1 Tax=Tistlia consotensis USBA 355 TaxID=560819 RepID=A0A1Y6B8U2_9PROT|nr:aminopeptidase P family protein [Tistlia consotensis]SME97562.1 Xaa-Pro aminopeptidase [Tistlia consotensis USBA 355]SNR56894.1 Xaa-Pro aminopeptidase [Tistlia consotensis]